MQIFNYLRRRDFCKKAKEASVIGDDIQIFNYLHRQGFCKKAKEASVIGDDIQIFNYLHRQGFCKKAKETSIIGESFQSIRAAGAPLLFDLLSYLFSQKSRPKAAFFILYIPLNSSFRRQAR